MACNQKRTRGRATAGKLFSNRTRMGIIRRPVADPARLRHPDRDHEQVMIESNHDAPSSSTGTIIRTRHSCRPNTTWPSSSSSNSTKRILGTTKEIPRRGVTNFVPTRSSVCCNNTEQSDSPAQENLQVEQRRGGQQRGSEQRQRKARREASEQGGCAATVREIAG